MSTKNHTDTQNTYNQAGMNSYNAFQPALQSQLLQMAQNPFGTPGFQSQMGFTSALNNQLAARNTSTAMRNFKTGGGILGKTGALTSALAQRGALSASSMASSGFQNALSGALNNRNFALGAMESYQPLQTGSTTQQYQTGLGTWLGPAINAGLSMAMPGIGGMMAGTGFMSGYRGAGAAPSSAFMGSAPPQIFTQPPPQQLSNPWALAGGYNPFASGAF